VGETILRRIRAVTDKKVSRAAFGGSLFDVCYVGGGEAHAEGSPPSEKGR